MDPVRGRFAQIAAVLGGGAAGVVLASFLVPAVNPAQPSGNGWIAMPWSVSRMPSS